MNPRTHNEHAKAALGKPVTRGRERRGTDPTNPLEHVEQAHLMAWAVAMRRQNPELALLFAHPNANKRTLWEQRQRKAEGMSSGIPDLQLPVARQGYHGLWIELKRRKGGVVSPPQREWHDRLMAQGYRVAVCHGADEAKAVLVDYLTAREGGGR